MIKFSCTMVVGSEDFFFVTLVAETARQARERRGLPLHSTVARPA